MKLILIFALMLALSSCATVQPASKSNAEIYSERNYPLLESGQMKYSDYYIGMYNSFESQPNYVTGEYLSVFNGLINNATDFESGKMTKEEFASKRREAKANLWKIDSDYQLKRQEIEAQRPVQPPPYIPYVRKSHPTTTNCNTYGNNTTCTTY